MERGQPSNPDLFLHIPFNKRWDSHKNTIHQLYISEDLDVEDVADIMKHRYLFDANVRQYKYRFRKWGFFKSIPSAVKEQAIQTLGKRIRDDIPFEGIRYKGVEVNKKRLIRYIGDEVRLNSDFALSPPVFGRWNLPYPAMKAAFDYYHIALATPGSGDFSTPSDYSVFSPPVTRDRPTPTNAPSPADAPTPTTRAIQVKTYHDRSKFLIQGEIDQFLKGMPSSDKKVVTTWLHQFWMFAFTTLKYWGKGPQKWTADMLRMTEFPGLGSLPGSPAVWRESQVLGPSDTSQTQSGTHITGHQYEHPQPSPLCRWCIHVREVQYESIPSPLPEEEVNYDGQDVDNWPRWGKEPCTVMERLNDALEDNSFSSMNTQDLPLSTAVIATAAASSPNAMTVEVIGFAIMARNVDLVCDWIVDINGGDLDLSNIYPYHLAASYLDGSGVCCDMFLGLMDLVKQNVIKRLYVNDLNHTVLDSLMLTILKAHTSCTPGKVDHRLTTMARFPGEDIDICGRWDADSPCLRALNANGAPRIPFSWKHMFCHTSVQAVCHAIIRIFGREYSPDINTPSGLFKKSCLTCGDDLVLRPLHTLVLTAFNLAEHGCHGENLFGIVACLVCLLEYGADPTARANLSVDKLLETDEEQHCTHVLLNPLELGEKVSSKALNSWSEEVKLGWNCFMAVLGFAWRQRTRGVQEPVSGPSHGDIYFHYSGFPSPENQSSLDNFANADREDDYDCWNEECDHSDSVIQHLGVLWSAIQTELLSYRRLREGDPWLSQNFNLTTVRDGANEDVGFSRLLLVDKEMMKPACTCGRFENRADDDIVTVEEACSLYFSNMEDWYRSTHRTLLCRYY
ncbi:hypothetical protein F4859DRAFT_501062 [Xylaria cf. heliscus]|nr:hypothetical protein F4859DRAFT_501062 [Xylaria cf. heliscus]